MTLAATLAALQLHTGGTHDERLVVWLALALVAQERNILVSSLGALDAAGAHVASVCLLPSLDTSPQKPFLT